MPEEFEFYVTANGIYATKKNKWAMKKTLKVTILKKKSLTTEISKSKF